MSTALQKHQAFSPRSEETGEWHPHKDSFTPLPPLAVQSREKGDAVSKSQFPERSYPGNELKIQGLATKSCFL